MFTEIIKENWKNANKNDKAEIELWNSKADYFGSYELEKVQNEKFIQIIKENNLIDKDSYVLDVGCGAGKYCTALADDCYKCVGTDLSPKMIEFARQKSKQYGKNNVEFRCDDWAKLDIEKENLIHKFDLVMACMTPAISDFETFKKYVDCSKGAGIYCSGTRRTDSVSDEIDKMLKIEKQKTSEDTVLYVFNILWEMGYYPNLEYINQSWDSEMTLEKACEVYINRCKAKHNIDEKQEQMVKSYLENISQNGIVYEKINTIKAVIYWKN